MTDTFGDKTGGLQGDRYLYAVKLSEDYLSFTDTYKRIEAAARREAPVISYKDGYYYIVTLGLTGCETTKPNSSEQGACLRSGRK